MDRERQRRQVDDNYEAFQRQLARLLPDHEDEFALMRDGEVVALLPTATAALRDGYERFNDEYFSVQEVTTRPIDLGVFSHAGS